MPGLWPREETGDLVSERPTSIEADPAPAAISLSYTTLSKYQQCGKAYKLNYIDKVPTMVSGAAIAGTAVHTVIEEMILEGWWQDVKKVMTHGAERFQALFMEGLKDAKAKIVLDVEGRVVSVEDIHWGGRKHILFDENGEEVTELWLDCALVHPEDATVHEPQCQLTTAKGVPKVRKVKANENYFFFRHEGPTWVKRAGTILRRDAEGGAKIHEAKVEVFVSAWLDHPGGTKITGYIDYLYLLVNADGELTIRDWKTGTYIQPIQLANYAWLVEQSMGVEVSRGEIGYLRGASSDTWIRAYDLNKWKGLVPMMYQDAVHGIDSGVFQISPSTFCGSCWVKEHCPYGKTLEDS